jgi:hypothetical protein
MPGHEEGPREGAYSIVHPTRPNEDTSAAAQTAMAAAWQEAVERWRQNQYAAVRDEVTRHEADIAATCFEVQDLVAEWRIVTLWSDWRRLRTQIVDERLDGIANGPALPVDGGRR